MENQVTIKRFLSTGSGYGSGYGDGDGDGDGSGYGSGDGSGSGSGSGDGSGYGDGDGSGYGSGSGSGYGSGYGYGSGSGDGSGSGSGSGDGLSKYKEHSVYLIDSVQTLIYSVKGNVARGAILREDLTLEPCFIAKQGNSFAHGEDIRSANRDALAKHQENMPDEERIERFLEEFKLDQTYSSQEFFVAHGWLTGSCEMGRTEFIKRKGIDLKSLMSVREFIDLTKGEYGASIIAQLAKALPTTDPQS